jgi:hypothetical protein
MPLVFNDIIEELLAGESGKYLPEGLAHSLPIIGRENGRTVDCFFIFSYCYGREEFNSPIAWLANDTAAKKLVYYYDVREKALLADSEPCSYPLDFKFSKDERRTALQTYQNLYVDVRNFAFSDNLDLDQKKKLFEYMRAFNTFVASSQKPFYVALSTEFFEWMTTKLQKGHA